MRLKDIEVGREYAIGPAGDRHSPRRGRGRVVEVGVYGSTFTPVIGRVSSARADYVEFVEVAAEAYEEEGLARRIAHLYWAIVNPEDGEVLSTREVQFEGRKGEKRLRCPARDVLCTWEEFAEREAARLEKEEIRQAARDQNESRVRAIIKALGEALGIQAVRSSHLNGDLVIELTLDDAEALVELARQAGDPRDRETSRAGLVAGVHRCDESPTGSCEYDEAEDPCNDDCVHCGQPEERK